jgi:hypothetical protein
LPLSSLNTRSSYWTGTTGGDGDGLERLLSHRLLISDNYVDRGQTVVITWMEDMYRMWASTETVANIHEQTHISNSTSSSTATTAATTNAEEAFHCSHRYVCVGFRRLRRLKGKDLSASPKSDSRLQSGNQIHSRRKYEIIRNKPAIGTAATTIALFYVPLSSTYIHYWLLARWPVSSMYTDYRLDPVPSATAYVYIQRT